jgi:hypothetical protein
MLVIGFAGGRIQAVPANLILVKNISVGKGRGAIRRARMRSSTAAR